MEQKDILGHAPSGYVTLCWNDKSLLDGDMHKSGTKVMLLRNMRIT